jgi:hypothetical protein
VGKKNYRPPLHDCGALKKYPKAMLELIEKMWSPMPEDRPSMMEVVASLSDMTK